MGRRDREPAHGGAIVIAGIGWCGLCGTPLDAHGARTCGCAPLSELAIVASRALVLAARSGRVDVRTVKRAMRIASAAASSAPRTARRGVA